MPLIKPGLLHTSISFIYIDITGGHDISLVSRLSDNWWKKTKSLGWSLPAMWPSQLKVGYEVIGHRTQPSPWRMDGIPSWVYRKLVIVKKTSSPVVLSSTCPVLCLNPNDLQLMFFTESQDTTMLSWLGLSVFFTMITVDCDIWDILWFTMFYYDLLWFTMIYYDLLGFSLWYIVCPSTT